MRNVILYYNHGKEGISDMKKNTRNRKLIIAIPLAAFIVISISACNSENTQPEKSYNSELKESYGSEPVVVKRIDQEILKSKNDYVSEADSIVRKYTSYLNLDSKMPAVYDVHYAKGTYLAVASDKSVYYSKNLDNWRKLDTFNADKAMIIADPENGFLIIKDGEVYITEDGIEIKHLKGAGKFLKSKDKFNAEEGLYSTPDILFFKNKIIVYDEYKRAESKIYGEYNVMKMPIEIGGSISSKNKRILSGIVNDGEVLLATASKLGTTQGSNDDYLSTSSSVVYSFDGINWNVAKNNIEGGRYDIGEITLLPKKNNKGYFEFFTYDCEMIYNYYSYTIKDNKLSITKDGSKGFRFMKQNTEEILFNFSVPWVAVDETYEVYKESQQVLSTYFLNKRALMNSFNQIKYQDDIIMILDLMTFYKVDNFDSLYHDDDGSVVIEGFKDGEFDYYYLFPRQWRDSLGIKSINGKFYLMGMYGSIIEIDENLNQRWVGLYQRDTLEKSDMENPKIGGKLGITKKFGALQYNNTMLPEKYTTFSSYYSTPGAIWEFKGTLEKYDMYEDLY